MRYYIFGTIKNREITFVGCTQNPDLSQASILLQIVEHHPEVHWVKWSVRFRRTLTDKKALDHPFTKYFRNALRLRCVLGDEDFERLSAYENARFLKFHQDNLHLLDWLIQAALAKKAEGRSQYSLDQLLGDARWGDTEIERGTDRVKINGRWSAWYSRALQLAEPKLPGFFTVRSSAADALVWIDGRSWQQFASEHADEIQWSDPFDELPDSDWEYTE